MQDYSTEPVKRLYRSKYDRMISGVCGGIADYLSIDVILIRILWIIITLFGGVGLLLYIAGIIIIPENPNQFESEDEKPTPRHDKTLFWGALLIIAGAILLFKEMGFFHYFHIWNIPWQIIWAVLLILLGIFLLYNRSKSNDTDKASEGTEEMPSESKTEDKKQVYRSRSDKMLAGVCGGLAEYFNFDATIVRLAYVLLSLASVGLGILIYIVMVFVFPEKPFESVPNSEDAEMK